MQLGSNTCTDLSGISHIIRSKISLFFKDCPYKYVQSVNLCTYRSLNLKTNLVRMTLVLHKHKVAHGNCILFLYICCRKALRQLQYHLNVFQLFAKELDIQMILQLSRVLQQIHVNTLTCFPHAILCLCSTTVIPTGQAFKFKTCKSINLQTSHIYKDSL